MKTKQIKTEKTFYCPSCRLVWKSSDYEIDENLSGYNCLDNCPNCGISRNNVHHSYQNLVKAWEKSTGPKSKAGKERSKMNAYKNGLYSESIFAPALYDKYPECSNCENRFECKAGLLKHCRHHLESALRIVEAYNEGNVSEIKKLPGIIQASNFISLRMAQHELMDKGIVVESVHPDFTESKINPALKAVEKLQGLLGFTAAEQEMTPASTRVEADEDEINFIDNAGSFIEKLQQTAESVTIKMRKAEGTRSEDSTLQNLDNEEETVEIQELPDENPML